MHFVFKKLQKKCIRLCTYNTIEIMVNLDKMSAPNVYRGVKIRDYSKLEFWGFMFKSKRSVKQEDCTSNNSTVQYDETVLNKIARSFNETFEVWTSMLQKFRVQFVWNWR